MEKYNKVQWEKGLDITPEVFINADNYHIAERSLLGRFVASRLHGILPGRRFHIEHYIDNDHVDIKILEGFAITRDGYMVNIQEDNFLHKKIALSDVAGSDFYVVLTVNPYSEDSSDENNRPAYTEYDLVLKKTEEVIRHGIPILKIYKDVQRWNWEIDNDYIPPAIALQAVNNLKWKFDEIKNKVDRISEKLLGNDTVHIQALLLKLELDNYCLQESPQELTLLLKKFCCVMQLYVKVSKNIEEFPVLEKFMEERYNHNEIGQILYLASESLTEIDEKIDEKPVEPKEEEEVIMEIRV